MTTDINNSGSEFPVMPLTSIDQVPASGSANLVTSGGVKAALTGLESNLAAIHATGTTNTTGAAIAKRTYFYLNGALVKALTEIDVNEPFTVGTNYAAVTEGGLNELETEVTDLRSALDGSKIKTFYVSAYKTATFTFPAESRSGFILFGGATSEKLGLTIYDGSSEKFYAHSIYSPSAVTINVNTNELSMQVVNSNYTIRVSIVAFVGGLPTMTTN